VVNASAKKAFFPLMAVFLLRYRYRCLRLTTLSWLNWDTASELGQHGPYRSWPRPLAGLPKPAISATRYARPRWYARCRPCGLWPS